MLLCRFDLLDHHRITMKLLFKHSILFEFFVFIYFDTNIIGSSCHDYGFLT